MIKEIWNDIKGYEGLYQISNNGRVKSLERKSDRTNSLIGKHSVPTKERILKSSNKRYAGVTLVRDGIKKYPNIHRLVAENFIANPFNLPCVNHIDGNGLNNCVTNLEWCNQSQNTQHAYNTGLHKGRKGIKNKLK